MSTWLSVTTGMTTEDAVTSDASIATVTDKDTIAPTVTKTEEVTLKTSTVAIAEVDVRTTPELVTEFSPPSIEPSTSDSTTASSESLALHGFIPVTTPQTTSQTPPRTSTRTTLEITTQTPPRTSTRTTLEITTQTPPRISTRTTPPATTRGSRHRKARTPAPDPVVLTRRPEQPSWTEGDKRPSAIGVGVVAILLTAGFFVGLLLLDMAALRRDFRTLRRNVRCAVRRMKPRNRADAHVVKSLPLEQ
ncbi:hypothetical protein LSAT2_015860 [Lamellibrachia satsuma]|nr:hypothetical protein LSAT2_015860 [Lamellibrachia satsuma]